MTGLQPPPTVRRDLGTLILTLGALIASLSGLCTLYVDAVALIGMVRGEEADPIGPGGLLMASLVIGWAPTLFGLLLVWIGLRIRRSAKPPRAPPPSP